MARDNRIISDAFCGTEEQWSEHLKKYINEHNENEVFLIPGKLYIEHKLNESHKMRLNFICSKAWCEWLVGLREELPDE